MDGFLPEKDRCWVSRWCPTPRLRILSAVDGGPRTRVPVLKKQSSHVFFKVLKEVKNLCSAQAYKEPCAKHEFRPIRGKKKKCEF